MAETDLRYFIPEINRWYWMEIQDVDYSEIGYNFIGKLVREESGYEISTDRSRAPGRQILPGLAHRTRLRMAPDILVGDTAYHFTQRAKQQPPSA
jgi:hypothetical protein